MARPSSVKLLSPEILAEVNRLLADGRHTLDDIVEHLRGLGQEVSRSALGRHKQRFNAVAERLRQSREITATFVQELGESVMDGEQGRLLAEMVRGLVYEQLEARMTGEQEADPKAIAMLGRTLKELAHATRLSQDYEVKVREIAAREAAQRMEESAAKAGVSPDVVRHIRRDILRMSDEA